MKIDEDDWELIWTKFDEWVQNPPRNTCQTCQHTPFNEYEWPAQIKKIESLVNKRLKGRKS